MNNWQQKNFSLKEELVSHFKRIATSRNCYEYKVYLKHKKNMNVTLIQVKYKQVRFIKY